MMLWHPRAFFLQISVIVTLCPFLWTSTTRQVFCFVFSIFHFLFFIFCFGFFVLGFSFCVFLCFVFTQDQCDCHSVSGSLDPSRPAKFCERRETLFLATRKHQLIVRLSEESLFLRIIQISFQETESQMLNVARTHLGSSDTRLFFSSSEKPGGQIVGNLVALGGRD